MYQTGTDFIQNWLQGVQERTFTNDFDPEIAEFEHPEKRYHKGTDFASRGPLRYTKVVDVELNSKLRKEEQPRSQQTSNVVKESLQVDSFTNISGDSKLLTDEMDNLSINLNDYYEDHVQDSLDRKNTCEDIAYSVAHKVLRKVQTVDDRFRANSLVPHGIPYDGLKAGEPIYLEMVLQLCVGDHNSVFTKREKDSAFVRIQLMSSDNWEDCLTTGGFLSASKVQHVLRRYTKQAVHVLRKYISQGKRDKLPERLYSLFLEEGPTITLTVNNDIRVRILPALSIPDSRTDLSRKDCPSSSHVISVPKVSSQAGVLPFVDGCPLHVTREDGFDIAWRLSFFVAEKNKIRTLGCGCKMQLLRTLTDIRDNHGALKALSSYHLKTVLLHECDFVPESDQWESDKLSERFISLLYRLKSYLSTGICPHYFMHTPDYPDINLFQGIDKNVLHEMEAAVQGIILDPFKALALAKTKQRLSPWPWEKEGHCE